MESNFQKCNFLDTGAGGTEDREGILLKGEVYWRGPRTWRPKGNIVRGVVVEHRFHNAEIVSHRVIMNSYVPCVYSGRLVSPM